MDDAALNDWLRTREEADRASRSMTLTQAMVAALPGGTPLRIVDLATGTGANVRYLSERIGGAQQWLVIDRSTVLLDAFATRMCEWARRRRYSARVRGATVTVCGPAFHCEIERRVMDLGPLDDPSIVSDRHLVTASALLDLVSVTWLERLAALCHTAEAAALFTIVYDGRFTCRPDDDGDEEIRGLFNAHQLRDKGLGGPAAGPAAAAAAERAFAGRGFRVHAEPSDWILGPQDAAIQRTLIDGWADAAIDTAPQRRALIDPWRQRRLAQVDTGRAHAIVGHRDVAAWPPQAEARVH